MPWPRRTGSLLCLAWMLGGCASPSATAQPAAAVQASAISAITLERGCFGCPTSSLLVLRRDGTASYAVTGNARSGTADTAASGNVSPADFDALARLAIAQGFFQLKDQYEDPQLRDGPWATTGIARGTQDKRVFRRDDAAPEGLRTVESAIEAVQARISFVTTR